METEDEDAKFRLNDLSERKRQEKQVEMIHPKNDISNPLTNGILYK